MDDILTTSEAAQVLGIDPRTVTWRVRNGRMTAMYKAPGNGSYLFDRAEIERIAEKDAHTTEVQTS